MMQRIFEMTKNTSVMFFHSKMRERERKGIQTSQSAVAKKKSRFLLLHQIYIPQF